MRKSLVVVLMSSFVVVGTACSSPAGTSSTEASGTTAGALSVAANTSTSFDATFTAGAAWARARTEYTIATTLYEITTSQGTVVVRTGTGVDGRAEANRVADPRTVEGIVHVAAADPEHAILASLLDALIAAGASEDPTRVQAGSTLYAAAYFTASALGLAAPTKHAGEFTRISSWPYPGFYSKDDMPTELVGTMGLQNGSTGVPCCGPFLCYDADWSPSEAGGCDDWCAAGDACNAWGWGSCGTAFWWPSGGCNSCPHSDSAEIKTYDPSGYNNGTCSPRGYDPGTTHNGPASNFDAYGNSFFGSGGGEYGSGPNDHF
jgi:hypothetical protein